MHQCVVFGAAAPCDTGDTAAADPFTRLEGFGNIFQILTIDYKFELTDYFEGNLIIKATPEKQNIFNYILIGVAPGTWTIRAVEHFDRNNELISQTRYLTFASVGDSLYFPTTVETLTRLTKQVMVESTYLRQVQLNVNIGDNFFLIPDNNDTIWTEQPFGKR